MSPDPAGASLIERVRELERFALDRLPSMQLADGAFCEKVVAGERPSGRSLRSTLIVLIGLLRAEDNDIDHPFHAGALRTRLLSELGAEELTPGDFGLALWAESRARGSAAEELIGALGASLAAAGGMDALPGQEIAWILIGLAESEARGEIGAGERILSEARAQLLESRRSESGLFAHTVKGPRRRFPNFATEVYAILALSQLARLRDDDAAREAARRAGDVLLGLQLDDGGWPWILDAKRGTIVEPYELHSVNQDALAPMGLGNLTEATGDPSYRAAGLRGLDWIWGNNDLGAEMLDREAGMIYRSIRRKERLDRAYLYGRTATSYVRPPKVKDARKTLEVDRADHPYHLGWILEAWAGKEELAGEG